MEFSKVYSQLDFHKKVKIALIIRDKTAKSLADEMGISVGHLNDILKGYRKSIKRRKQIVEILGMEDGVYL